MVKHKIAYASSAAALMLGAGFLAPVGVYAGTNDLVDCLDGSSEVCTLQSDITLAETIQLTRDVTIDLNGHNITATGQYDAFRVQGANVRVTGTGSIVAEVYSPFEIEGSVDSTASNYSVLTIDENVTLKSVDDYTIWMSGAVDANGARHGYGAVVNMNGASDSMYGYYINGGVQDVAENAPIFNFGDTAKLTSKGHAIYAAGYGHWNLNGVTIDADEGGIGIKAGTFALNDANIKVYGNYPAPESFGNGINESGAVLQIESHDNYSDNVEISINGGRYESEHSNIVLEYKDKENTQNSVKSFSIKAGEFIVSGENKIFNVSDNFKLTQFITGGEFSIEPDEAYVANGYKAIKTGEDYVVSPLVTSIELGAGEEVVELMSNEFQAMRIAYTPTDAAVDFEVSTNNSAIFAEDSLRIEYDGTVPGLLFAAADSGSGEAVVTVTEKNSGVSASVKVKVTEVLKSDSSIAEDGTTVYTYFETPIEGENLAVEISGEELSDAEKAKISPYLKAVYDISVVNQDTDEVVPVSNNRIDVMLVLNPDDYEGMKYFKVVYINENGELAETFDTEVQTDEDGNAVALLFTTTHLSAYGVLASATEFPEVLAPDTGIGELMEAGSSYDYRGLVSAVVALTVMTVAMEVVLWKRNQTRK